jgi:nitric oxide reductase NorQ protein
MNDVLIERMEAANFAPKDGLKYVDMFNLMPLYEGLAFRAPSITVGPKGIGKTLSYQVYASRVKSPIITFDCSEDVRRTHLLGSYVLRGDTSPFVLGPVPLAFEIANEVGQCILVFEEINALTPQMQKVLNAVADWRQSVEVPEARRAFRLKPGAKLWVVGTMNTAVYGGVHALNEDLKSRFRLIATDYPKPAAEKATVLEVLDVKAKKIDEKFVDKALLLAHETRQKSLDYMLSTRDIVQFIEDIAYLGLELACRVLVGKFEDADRDTVQERIMSIFPGVKFEETKKK